MQEPCRGVWGYPPLENFQIGRLRNVIFSTCHEICLRKIDLEYENGKQLQVTIIKITESKENKSIQRLDVSGSTCPRGDGGAAAPLASTALGSGTTKRDSFFVSPSLPLAYICGNCGKDCQ